MGSPSSFYEIRKQASFFFQDKLRSVRLALTDVTPAQLLTEEATNGNPWPPDTRAMGVIARAAFEIDDYWRIVDILHKRLIKFEVEDWRVSYKTLILFEHLLTHGPQSFAEEFQSDRHVIKKMTIFHYIDDKKFDWGLSVRTLSERVLKLLDDFMFLREERSRARKLSRGIEGFGSFSCRSLPTNSSWTDSDFKSYSRCKSYCNDQQQVSTYYPLDNKPEKDWDSWLSINGDAFMEEEDHPFCDNENQTRETLLSSSNYETFETT